MSPLAFPTSWGESNELEFRDGRRVVPEYLATLMGSFDTSEYTYDQAIDMVNRGFVGEAVSKAQGRAIKQHFEQARDGTRR